MAQRTFFSSLILLTCCKGLILGQELADTLDSQGVALGKLESRLSRLDQLLSLKTETLHDENGLIDQMNVALDDVTGNGCKAREFRCSWGHPQCVSYFKVCDGDVDCFNDADEDITVCDNPTKEGSVFDGIVTYDTCLGQYFESAVMYVHGEKRCSATPWKWEVPISYVDTMLGHGEDDAKIVTMFDTYYSPGERMLWHTGCDPHRCGLVDNWMHAGCKFDVADKTKAICYCWRVSDNVTKPPCCIVHYKKRQ